jgi:hypothetical protein
MGLVVSKVFIGLIAVSWMTQSACADTLSIVEREVKWVTDPGPSYHTYQITLGINDIGSDGTGPSEAMAGWQLVCQIIPAIPDNVLDVSAVAPSDYIFSNGSAFDVYCSWDPSTLNAMFLDFTESPQVPETGKNNLVKIALSSGATEPFGFQIAFVPYNNGNGSFWYTDPNDPLTTHRFDFSSIPEPSCIHILLSGVAVFLITMVNRRRYAHRAFSSCWRKTSGFRGHVWPVQPFWLSFLNRNHFQPVQQSECAARRNDNFSDAMTSDLLDTSFHEIQSAVAE